MSSVFICDRCGTKWGWLVKQDGRKLWLRECLERKCNPAQMRIRVWTSRLLRRAVVV